MSKRNSSASNASDSPAKNANGERTIRRAFTGEVWYDYDGDTYTATATSGDGEALFTITLDSLQVLDREAVIEFADDRQLTGSWCGAMMDEPCFNCGEFRADFGLCIRDPEQADQDCHVVEFLYDGSSKRLEMTVTGTQACEFYESYF